MATGLVYLATISFWALTIYEWITIIAILVTWVNPDPRNPIIQFLNNMTVPVWNWFQGWLPSALKLFSAYIALLAVWFLEIFVPGSLRGVARYSAGYLSAGQLPGVLAGFLLLGLGVVVKSLLFFLILLLVVWFFLTLVNPSVNNPIVRTLFMLVDPFITPIQRRLPRQRVDISPLLAAGLFLLLYVLVVSPLVDMAAGLAQAGSFSGAMHRF
ncbi:MAG TPA: YggT family protein [bacterium]|nr:YggT family protein [bacterium]